MLDKVCEVAFFLSGGIVGYAYILYPMIMGALPSVEASAPSKISRAMANYPTVSMLISAYNEGAVIRARIRNFLEGRYPGWSEIIIVSDGSTDATAEVARAMVSDRVRVLELPENRGKATGLDFAVKHARGEIL